jgi:hypothetical protein
MRASVNRGAARSDGLPALKGRLPFRAIGAASGIPIVGSSRAISLSVLWNKDTQDDMSTNLFLAAGLRGCGS